MKFDLIIKDATLEEIANITQSLWVEKTAPEIEVAMSKACTVEELVAENPNIHVPTTQSEAYQVGKQVLNVAVQHQDGTVDTFSTEDVSGQLDSDGLPWDARIHSSSKKKKADGTWTRRKNVADSEFDSIKAQLLGSSVIPNGCTAPAPIVQTTPFQNVVAPTSQDVVVQMAPVSPFSPEQQAANTPVMPVMPTFLQRAPEAPVAQTYTMNDLFTKIQQGIGAGKLQPDAAVGLVNAINQSYGVKAVSLVDFAQRPDLIKACIDILVQAGV